MMLYSHYKDNIISIIIIHTLHKRNGLINASKRFQLFSRSATHWHLFSPGPLGYIQPVSFVKCFFKIRWTIYSDMPTFRAISRTVNLTSPSMISFILETIFLRDTDFGLPDFGAFLCTQTLRNFFFHRLTVL